MRPYTGYYSTYRWCAVPECKNTSIKTPDKLWIQVPADLNVRKTWFVLARRDPELITKKTRLYFCEDHFDLEHDMANYIQYKVMGSVKRIRLKPHCIPSRFDWNRKEEDNVKSSSSWTEVPELVAEDAEAEIEDEVPKVCRACLASGVRMVDVAAGGLQDTFEHVTGTELHTGDERPTQVCYVCCSQLQRFRAFCQMSRKAETYMTKLLKQGLQITDQAVSKCHRLIKPNLDVTKNPILAIHTREDPNKCVTVEVKVEVEDKNKSDSETESENEIESEVKMGANLSERDSKRENETEETKLNWEEGEIKIEIDEIDIEEFDPFEAIEHSLQQSVGEETCYCIQCAAAFPSQSELLKHIQNHTHQKLKQANTTRQNVKTKRTKRDAKTKVESQCKFCNKTFAMKTQLVTHVAMEHGFGEFLQAQQPKRRKPNILKKKQVI